MFYQPEHSSHFFTGLNLIVAFYGYLPFFFGKCCTDLKRLIFMILQTSGFCVKL